jgi:putative transposase
MFNQIIAGKSLPRYLSSDHDPLFRFHRWLANLRILEVEEIKSIPFVPVSHPFVERLIGTIRREFLDHVLIWNAVDLGRKLEEFRNYCNENRVHQSLNGSTPASISSSARRHARPPAWPCGPPALPCRRPSATPRPPEPLNLAPSKM